MKAIRFIKLIQKILQGALYLNIALLTSAVAYQLFNLIWRKQYVFTAFLGKFKVEGNFNGVLQSSHAKIPVAVDELSIRPYVYVDHLAFPYLLIVSVLFVGFVVLLYNYQLYKLFTDLDHRINPRDMFQEVILYRFKRLGIYSLILFGVGAVLGVVKILFLRHLFVAGMHFQPVLDNEMFNFLWMGLAFFVLRLIMSVGYEVKRENDLTI